MSYETTASRFLRPPDVARLRRNQRRIQMQRLLILLRNVLVLTAIGGGMYWAYSHARSNERFAVRTIEVSGIVNAPPDVVETLTAQYEGMNLFEIDLERVQRDLDGVGWVQRVDIEKTLPGTLRIKVIERTPVALVRIEERLLYVDQEGETFAELSPRTGNDDLPVISEASGPELLRTVGLLTGLRERNPEIYSRISEAWPIPPRGFALFDRSIGAVVYANQEDLVDKYGRLHAILNAESHPRIEYADLRFSSRIIVKPHVIVKNEAAENDTSLARRDGGEYVQN